MYPTVGIHNAPGILKGQVMDLKAIWLDNRGRLAAVLSLSALLLAAMAGGTRSAQAATAPVIASLGCPATAQQHQAITCTPAITGTVTRYSWDAGNDTGHRATFTTTFTRPGTHTVRLEACNGRDCARLSATVNVTATPRPRITSLGCPATTPEDQPVTCKPAITGNVTTYRWRAEGDNPGPSNGATFTTTFLAPGFRTVRLEACNGSVCDDAQAVIRVTRATSTLPAPVINSLGCLGNARVEVPLVCTADVTGTVTALNWSTAEGLPPTGTGPTFSTVFSQVGMATVTLQACNGTSCSRQSMPIAITVGDD